VLLLLPPCFLPTDCYDCIDERITIGGRANFCPVCNVLLGPNPYEHNKLKYDFILDSLVRKVSRVRCDNVMQLQPQKCSDILGYIQKVVA
jgi:hypothetical protein